MNRRLRQQSTDAHPVQTTLLREKFHPFRHPQMSNLMAAIVGFVIDAPFGEPRIADMIVTPEGFIMARAQGEVSLIAVARYDDLICCWFALLDAARLTHRERMEAEVPFAAKIGYFGRATA